MSDEIKFRASSTFEFIPDHQMHGAVLPATFAHWADQAATWARALPANADVRLRIDWTMEAADGVQATWELP